MKPHTARRLHCRLAGAEGPARKRVTAAVAVLLLAGALAAGSPGFEAGTAPPDLYDPALDIISPGTARWLYLGTLLYEAPAWSAGVNGMFGFGYDDRRAYAVQLLGTPASFFGFLWATRDRPTTLGMVAASWSGTWLGYGAGFVAGDLLFDWGQEPGSFDPRFGTAVAASVAGHIVGLGHAERERLNFGNTDMLVQAGAWSALYSAYLMSLPLPWDEPLLSETGVPWRRKLVEAAGLAGWYAGSRLWHERAPRDYTTGDAISTWNSNALSVLSAVAAGALQPQRWQDSEKGALLVPALVNAGGLAYGYRFHRGRDVTFGRSLLVSLGTALGAWSVGTAVAILATPGDREVDARLALTTTAAAGWGAFHLSHWLLDTGRTDDNRTGARVEPVRLVLSPANALGVLLAARTGGRCRVPLVQAVF